MLYLMVISIPSTVSILVQLCRTLLVSAKHSVKQQLLVMDSIIAEVIRDVGSHNVPPTRRELIPVQVEKDG